MKKITFISSLILLISFNSFASVDGASKFSQNILEEAFTAAAETKDTSEARDKIVNTVKNNIDINYISKFVLGKHWRRTTEAQRKEFSKIYEEYLILTYAPKFQGYNGETYTINSTEEITEGKYVTKATLILSDNTPLELEFFIIENADKKYKIVDISGEGISFAATQRSEFSSLISSKGVDRFIENLKTKVESLK